MPSFKKYVILSGIIVFLSGAALGLIIFRVNPETAGFFHFLLFYFVLWLFLSGFLFLTLIFFTNLSAGRRRRFIQKEKFFARTLSEAVIRNSFRRSIGLAGLAVFLLFLQSFRLLYWWNALFLTLSLIFLEIFYLNNKKEQKRNK